MNHPLHFLHDLTMVMLVAGITTIVFHYFKQPVVLGYILAGLIIGPHTPPIPLMQDEASIRTLSELGVVMLMFSLGLQFSFRQLVKVGPTAFIAATLEILLMVWIGYQVGRFFGWSAMDRVFLGAMLLSSSTVIIAKALNDLKMAEQKFAKFIFGILIIDDMAAIVAIAVLSGIALSGEFSAGEVFSTASAISIFLAVSVVVGLLILPRLLRFITRFNDPEVLLVSVLALGFGMALLASRLGFSTALGAFLIGTVIGETREGLRVKALVEPVRDMFSAIFFVSVGLRLDPSLVVEHWLPVVVVTITLVVGKTLTGALGSFVAGNDPRTSLRVGMGLAQIGEFAFIIAALGTQLGVTSAFLYPIAVSVSGITTLSTPYLIKNSDRLVNGAERMSPRGLTQSLDLYTAWVSRLTQAPQSARHQVRALLRRAALQLALNGVLTTGLLLTAAAVGGWAESRLPVGPHWAGGPRSAVWLIALILALPLLIPSFRKLRAIAMLLAEMSVPAMRTPEQTQVLRGLVGNVVFLGGAAAMLAWVLALSSAILPPWPGWLALALVVVGVAVVMGRTMARLYSRAQIALQETLAEPPGEPGARPGALLGAGAGLESLLEGAVLETVDIPAEAPAAGKRIGELGLRSRSGASIVGIQRDGVSIVNPGADEEIRSGDKVLLLGRPGQLSAAQAALTGEG